jgi:hypothetical protein
MLHAVATALYPVVVVVDQVGRGGVLLLEVASGEPPVGLLELPDVGGSSQILE